MKFLFTSFLLFVCLLLTAQPRFTDSTFGTNGKVVENMSVPYVDMIDALLQPDGKTLTLAASRYNAINRIVLIRYNTDGTADASFSGDGVADSLITPDIDCNPKAIRLQPDGKILVCGDAGDYYSKKPFVMRYKTDGSLDASFGTNGILYLPEFTVWNSSVNQPSADNLAVLTSGKIILLLSRYYPNTNFALTRITSTGTVDSAFGTNGTALVNPPGITSGNSQTLYTHIEVLPDGKYLVGGANYLLIKVDINGLLDKSYGLNGALDLSGNGLGGGEKDLLLQPDGKALVCAPQATYGWNTYISVLRTTANGQIDNSFGNGGKQIIYTSIAGFTAPKPQLGLQADGKILIGGRVKKSDGSYTMALARLTVTGAMDAGFDGDGIAALQVNGYNSFGCVPLQQSDGKIIITGFARSNIIRAPTIGRFTTTGQTDVLLNAATVATQLHNGTDYENSWNVLVQPADQKIVAVRERGNGYGGDFCVSRYLPNGQPDAAFGSNGIAYIDLPGYNWQYYSGISADGKITIIPDYGDYVTYNTLGVFRLKANGQPDSSFGQNGKKIFKSRNTDTIGNFLGSAAVQPDGKVLMAIGQNEGPSQIYQYPRRDSSFLIRLNNDGSFDNTFNGNGRKYLSSLGRVSAIAVQSDGKIILMGTANTDNNTYQQVIRQLNTDGSTDTSFNSGRDKIVPNEGLQITLQPDGKILSLSFANTITRLLSNGNYDSSFGVNGTVNATIYYPTDGYRHITNIKASSSRIILMGYFYDSTLSETVVKVTALKYNSLPDSTFGEAGVIFPQISTYPFAYEGLRMTLQNNEKVLVTGYQASLNNPDLANFALTRLKATNTTSTGRTYVFTGNGLWSNGANWADGTLPPATIPAGSSIVIDPPTDGECVIDISVQVQAGASVIIKAGKKVKLLGNLIIQ